MRSGERLVIALHSNELRTDIIYIMKTQIKRARMEDSFR